MKRVIWEGLVGFVLVFFLMFALIGCSSVDANKKDEKPIQIQTTVPKPIQTTVHPNKPLPPPVPKPTILMLNVSHFAFFKSDPMGAEVIVIDTKSGKEVQSFGRTPVRILLVTKKIQYDATNKKILNVTDVEANTVGLTYGQMGVDGVEFQFKFRELGFQDYIHVERIPLLSLDSEKIIGAALQKR